MIIPQFSRPGPVVLCSSAVCVLWAGIVTANFAMERGVPLDEARDIYSGGRLALAYGEPMPAWLQLPERSTQPVVGRIGLRSDSTAIRYRTLLDRRTVLAFHKTRLDWKELHWIDFTLDDGVAGSSLTSVGYNRVSGERVRIDIREIGYLRSVQIILSGGRQQTVLNDS